MDPRFLRRPGLDPVLPPARRAASPGVAAAWRLGTVALACVVAILAGGPAKATEPLLPDVGATIETTISASSTVVPLYEPRTEIERLQLLARTDPDAAATELERWIDGHPAPHPLRAEALRVLGNTYNSLSQGEQVERVARLADAMGDEDPVAKPTAMVMRAGWLVSHNEPAKADRLLIEASALMMGTVPTQLRLDWLAAGGNVKRRTGHHDDALRAYHEAITLADRDGPEWRQLDLRSGLVGVLLDALQPERAREVDRDIARRAAALHDESALGSVANHEAIILSDGGDAAATLAAWRGAIEHSRLAGSRRDVALNLADIADYYLTHGEFQTALDMSHRALSMARDLHSDSGLSVALGNIGLALISLHRKDEGMQYLREAMAVDERTSTSATIAASLLEASEYLEKAGYLQDAVQAYRQYRQIDEDAGQQDRQRAVLELQETFANEGRQHELDMLAREGKLKDTEIRHHELELKEWTAAGIASLLLAVVVGVLARRLRVRNQQLSVSNEALRIQAERDPLTGLANRHFLQAEMARRPAERGLEGTLYLLDVDHFKHINDRCGHAGGDTVLIEIAHRLRETLRADDLIIRWGGEEFLVLVKPMPAGESEAMAQRLLAALANESVLFDGRPVPVSASIGYSQFPLPGADVPVDWERAISLVDTAMYLSKAHGRNCATGIRRVDADAAERLDVLAQSLESAWREGRVELHLQHGPAVKDAQGSGAADARPRQATPHVTPAPAPAMPASSSPSSSSSTSPEAVR